MMTGAECDEASFGGGVIHHVITTNPNKMAHKLG
jgi:hypothetical protein